MNSEQDFVSLLSSSDLDLSVGGRKVELQSATNMIVTWEDQSLQRRELSGGHYWRAKDGVYDQEGPWELIRPQCFVSIEDLRDRSLDIEHPYSLDTLALYSGMLRSLAIMGRVSDPPVNLKVMYKTYDSESSGSGYDETWNYTDAFDVDYDLSVGPVDNRSRIPGGKTTVSFSGKIGVFRDGSIYPEKVYVIPVADLDVSSETEITKAVELLRSNGYSGIVASSGKNVHYVADFVLPGEESLWVYMSDMMHIMTPDNLTDIHHIADRLGGCKNMSEARSVSDEILNKYRSGDPTGSKLDIRHVAHSFLDNMGNPMLRCLPGKGYTERPTVFLRIK